MRLKHHLLIIFTLLIISTVVYPPFCDDSITIFINGNQLHLEVAPVIIDNRTLVPFRSIFEAIHADVSWNNDTRTAVAIKDKTEIKLTIGQTYGIVNHENIPLDSPALILNGRTLVPLRFISENMGFDVAWDPASKTISLTDQDHTKTTIPTAIVDKEFSFYGLSIGSTLDELITQLGSPSRIDTSIYDFEWYIYNEDYSNYIQFGIKNNNIVAICSNNAFWKSKNNFAVGSPKSTITQFYGNEITSILKGNTNYLYSESDPNDDYGLYFIEDTYVRFFYDHYSNNTLTSILLIEKNTEESLHGFYGNPSENSRISFEHQIFDMSNAIRVRNGLQPFTWNDDIADVARAHSKDMATYNFFAHENLNGLSPSERAEKAGVLYRTYAENIACGYSNAIYAHEGWMNSKGHRSNILADIKELGVGVAFGGDFSVYYTQNFRTPR